MQRDSNVLNEEISGVRSLKGYTHNQKRLRIKRNSDIVKAVWSRNCLSLLGKLILGFARSTIAMRRVLSLSTLVIKAGLIAVRTSLLSH